MIWMIAWSSISIATGSTPPRITAETASEAAGTPSKIASNVRTSGGRLTSATQIFVTMPSVPSDPQNTPRRSGPGTSGCRPPSQVSRPSGSTTSRPSTWFTVLPCASVCGPPAFVATFPPSVQIRCEDGSGA